MLTLTQIVFSELWLTEAHQGRWEDYYPFILTSKSSWTTSDLPLQLYTLEY